MTAPAIVWFRRDLRLADNPALCAALQRGGPLVCLYILDENGDGRPLGGASRWWLHASLEALGRDISSAGGRLILRRGPALAILEEVIAASGADAVFWNRLYESAPIARDTAIKSRLKERGIAAESFNGSLLAEPASLKTQSGEPFRVYTPFWRALKGAGEPPAPIAPPVALPPPPDNLSSETLSTWALRPTQPDWAGGLRAAWVPGEASARRRLAGFIDTRLAGYKSERDRPDIEGTSRLSPHLHFGEISPRSVWHAARAALGQDAACEKFLSELAWREFSHHLLFHFPDLPERNWRPAFDAIVWRDDPEALKAWERGATGYPIIDAGLRELWATGWMHNRVRMIAASFLVKHLLIDWRHGERWFWDTLVDADLANNAAGWQWVAGSGADAAPYFRIFNPVLQGEKFDPDGAYVRRWVGELSALEAPLIHRPYSADAKTLERAGIELGKTYPLPIVSLEVGRARALEAFEAVKNVT